MRDRTARKFWTSLVRPAVRFGHAPRFPRWVIRVDLDVLRPLPIYPDKWTFSQPVGYLKGANKRNTAVSV